MYYTKKLWAAGGGGGGVVYDFEPFVAPESFDHPSKYADFGCTVNLYQKFRVYKMTYPGADAAVEFSDEIDSVLFGETQLPPGSTIEVFETVLGEETSILYTTTGTHSFTSGSTKRYMIRRVTGSVAFFLPIGSVWAYCSGSKLLGAVVGNTYLKYVFFSYNTLMIVGVFSDTTIEGTLRINGSVTNISDSLFKGCINITKVITGYSVHTISSLDNKGAFQQCTSLQIADLGTGITSIGTDTFRDCTSLASIICRAYNPPTVAGAFNGIPATTNFYVPHERVNVYKAADGFAEFASRIYSINDL